jgi:hypothetical protein
MKQSHFNIASTGENAVSTAVSEKHDFPAGIGITQGAVEAAPQSDTSQRMIG